MALVARRAITGARGSGSVEASRACQFWIYSMPSRQVSSRLTPFPTRMLSPGALHTLQFVGRVVL